MSDSKVGAANYLNPPAVRSVRYTRNFIKTAVCELRFPTLLELESSPPRAFQRLIRKDYPFYEPRVIESGSGNDGMEREHHYLFRSKDQHWTVVVKSFALALETSKYTEFGDFAARLKEVLHHATEMIDSDFFTRVGLRYMNSVPIGDDGPQGWIRDELAAPIFGGVLGGPKVCRMVVQGSLKDGGGYSLRHGISDSDEGAKVIERGYLLDFDYFKEGVELQEVDSLIAAFNEINFAFFSWCLGPKAFECLGEGKPK